MKLQPSYIRVLIVVVIVVIVVVVCVSKLMKTLQITFWHKYTNTVSQVILFLGIYSRETLAHIMSYIKR